ncbi:hypothetical protein NC651_019499 [Populus alba x Populus x berolinensis]|nr:hypothetical protein NC651_019499 [Populus alba x Populus x berolinensis]
MSASGFSEKAESFSHLNQWIENDVKDHASARRNGQRGRYAHGSRISPKHPPETHLLLSCERKIGKKNFVGFWNVPHLGRDKRAKSQNNDIKALSVPMSASVSRGSVCITLTVYQIVDPIVDATRFCIPYSILVLPWC